MSYKSKVLSRTRLRVESLEKRLMLDGNVVAKVIAGNLIITGDAADNLFTVTPGTLAGQVVVTGVATTVNGKVAGDTLGGVTKSITINLGKGNNDVAVGQQAGGAAMLIARDLVITGLSGEDQIGLTSANVGGSVRINASSGDDVVGVGVLPFYIEGTILGPVSIAHDLAINMACGPDRAVTVANARIGNDLSIVGANIQQVLVQDVSLGDDLTISTGSGNNFVQVLTVQGLTSPLDCATIATGAGNDGVSIYQLQAKYLTVNTGSGMDGVTITESAVAKDAAVDLSCGGKSAAPEFLNVGSTTVGRNAVFCGGAGFDVWTDLGGNTFGKLKRFGFEI